MKMSPEMSDFVSCGKLEKYFKTSSAEFFIQDAKR